LLYFKPAPLTTVKILDSTLREGEQSVGVSFTKKQRLQIAWMLDRFGVDCIEISPVVSESHKESLKEMLRAGLRAEIIAHGRALGRDIDTSIECGARWIAMYHSISDIHLKSKLHISREDALERSLRAVDYAKAQGLKLRFTLEDATRADPDYLLHFIRELDSSGVDRIGIPDTVGAMLPQGMAAVIKIVRSATDIPIDVHCHNDLGLALANSLAAAEAGADQIHVTIDGLGERVGIASLSEVSIALKMLYGEDRKYRFEMLSELSRLIASYNNDAVPINKPIVGKNAYTHKAGTHLAAIIESPGAYEIVSPEFVGNKRRLVFGELSGKNGSAFLLKILGLEPTLANSQKLAAGLKKLQQGDLFELPIEKEDEEKALEVERELAESNALRAA
jgi:isopropylmalate/homocitrate/citramalate synthase